MVKCKKENGCPCGSGKNYVDCCGPYISGALAAPNAQALMRSRYSAYTLEDEAYLQKTWHPDSRPDKAVLQQARCKWIGLQVIAHHQKQQTATVEFIAKFKVHGRAEKMHEISRFVYEDGRWLYLDGEVSN